MCQTQDPQALLAHYVNLYRPPELHVRMVVSRSVLMCTRQVEILCVYHVAGNSQLYFSIFSLINILTLLDVNTFLFILLKKVHVKSLHFWLNHHQH